MLPPLTDISAIELRFFSGGILNYVNRYSSSESGAVPFWHATEQRFGEDCDELFAAMNMSDIVNFVYNIEGVGSGEIIFHKVKNERLKSDLGAYQVANIFLRSYKNATADDEETKYKGYHLAAIWMHENLTFSDQASLLTLVSLERDQVFLDQMRAGYTPEFEAFTNAYFDGEEMTKKADKSSLDKIEAELEQQKRITELEAQILAERRMREKFKKTILEDDA